jgi:actin
MTNTKQTVVIDTGSYTCKAGLTGENMPRAVFPTVIGYTTQKEEYYVGHQAISKHDTLDLKYPVNKGVVYPNWDDIEKIWHHTLHNELQVVPEETAVLLTEPPRTGGHHLVEREKKVQLTFESFSVPSLYLPVKRLCAYWLQAKQQVSS